jgi:hypothetical protein
VASGYESHGGPSIGTARGRTRLPDTDSHKGWPSAAEVSRCDVFTVPTSQLAG